ncbi:MAG TPA: hypothetical protein VMT03_26105 [Polyangia bacterium]|nr:hypothetical protein [Polyangia bacterium]
MLKKIALTALFAITFAVGMGAASARTKAEIKPTASTPQGFCFWGMPC